jgi:uncharacterized protein YjiS (DUF1127 family)
METSRTGRVRTANRRVSGAALAMGLLALWLHLQAKQRSRRQLGRLDARLLRDVGIDPVSAQEEARRGFWQ